MYVGIICHFVRYLVHLKEGIKDRVLNLNSAELSCILLKLFVRLDLFFNVRGLGTWYYSFFMFLLSLDTF